MPNSRVRRRRLRLAALVTLGCLFQSTNCAIDTSQLLPQLITTIGGVLVSSFVNDLFGVQSTGL